MPPSGPLVCYCCAWSKAGDGGGVRDQENIGRREGRECLAYTNTEKPVSCAGGWWRLAERDWLPSTPSPGGAQLGRAAFFHLYNSVASGLPSLAGAWCSPPRLSLWDKRRPRVSVCYPTHLSLSRDCWLAWTVAAATVPWKEFWIGLRSPCRPEEHNDTLP